MSPGSETATRGHHVPSVLLTVLLRLAIWPFRLALDIAFGRPDNTRPLYPTTPTDR